METSNPYQPPVGDVAKSNDREADTSEQAAEAGASSKPWGTYIVAAFMAMSAVVLGQWILYCIDTWNGPYGGGSNPDSNGRLGSRPGHSPARAPILRIRAGYC